MKERTVFGRNQNVADMQLIECFKTEKAELFQNMTGKEDFFYFNWHTEDENAIFTT